MSETRAFVQKVKPVYIDTTGAEIPAPNLALPYPAVVLLGNFMTAGNFNINTARTVTFTVADWGAGMTFYPTTIRIILLSVDKRVMDEDKHGLDVQMGVQGGNIMYQRVFTPYNWSPIVITTIVPNDLHYFGYFENIYPTEPVTATQTLQVEIHSALENNLIAGTDQLNVYIGGVAIS